MSGWTTITYKTANPSKKLKPKIDNSLRQYDEHKPEVDDEDRHVINLVGYGREEEAAKIVRKIKPKKAVIISANDTTDSGDGIYLEKREGEMIQVDEFQGYEGACANDVAGYFREEYGFSAYPSYH